MSKVNQLSSAAKSIAGGCDRCDTRISSSCRYDNDQFMKE